MLGNNSIDKIAFFKDLSGGNLMTKADLLKLLEKIPDTAELAFSGEGVSVTDSVRVVNHSRASDAPEGGAALIILEPMDLEEKR